MFFFPTEYSRIKRQLIPSPSRRPDCKYHPRLFAPGRPRLAAGEAGGCLADTTWVDRRGHRDSGVQVCRCTACLPMWHLRRVCAITLNVFFFPQRGDERRVLHETLQRPRAGNQDHDTLQAPADTAHPHTPTLCVLDSSQSVWELLPLCGLWGAPPEADAVLRQHFNRPDQSQVGILRTDWKHPGSVLKKLNFERLDNRAARKQKRNVALTSKRKQDGLIKAKEKPEHHNFCLLSSQTWSVYHQEVLTKMGKMAFNMLQRNTSVFFEGDMKEHGLKPTEVTVCSGLCTELPAAASDGKRVFCFIHLTFQVKLFAAGKHRFVLAVNLPNTRRFEPHFVTSHCVVFSPPGVHGSSVRLHNVPLRVKERSGHGRVAHTQHLPIQGSEQISGKPGPLRCGANPQRAARTLRHVPALSVWPVVPVLPRQTAERVSLLSRGAKGEWTRWGAAAAGA